jgi:hypothetical protein
MILYKVTRIDFKLNVKDFPIGKIVSNHMWINGRITIQYADNILSKLSFNPLYSVENYNNISITYFENKPITEYFEEIIEDKIEDCNIQKNITNIDDIDLNQFDKDQLFILAREIRKTIFKKNNNMNDDDLNKLQNTSSLVIYENNKRTVVSNNSVIDDIKIKKNIIRENLKIIKKTS